MSAYLMKEISEPNTLTSGDFAPFVDADGRLELRLEGLDPFVVHDSLRAAGFERIHTWVDAHETVGNRTRVELRVTARLAPVASRAAEPRFLVAAR